ncbi:MAG: queuosine precursor transporter [Pseudomonadota bacterium]
MELTHVTENKSTRLFIILGGFFITNALVAQFISVKIFALEDTLGIETFDWNLFGQTGSLSFTVGVLLWPIVFVMTDIINEYYGRRGVRMLSLLAIGLISYACVAAYISIILTPAEWWVGVSANQGVPDMQAAFAAIFGQGMWIIIGSLTAFLVGQLVDVFIFQRIRRMTGENKIWLRATGSTLVSQFIDSYIVLYIAFAWGPQQWSLQQIMAVGTVNYGYKFLVAIALTPVLYLAHYWIDQYLGEKKAEEMKLAATM